MPPANTASRIATLAALAAATLGLAACGGGGSGFVPAPTYTIGGVLTGLAAGQQAVTGSAATCANAGGASSRSEASSAYLIRIYS
jgi:hypothetical protein